MKFLAIITALESAETIPKMYTRFLIEKPLFLYLSDSLKESKRIEDVYVFTDSDNIAHISEINNLKVIQSPDNIELGKEILKDVLKDIFKRIEDVEKKKYDYFIVLEPKFPFIKTDTIDKAIQRIVDILPDTAISVSYYNEFANRYWKENDKGLGVKIFDSSNHQGELYGSYKEIEGIFISNRKFLEKDISFYGGNIIFITLDFPENLKITNHIDWWVAEKLLKRKRILIRVDGYSQIGLGHIYRTLTLANRLIDHDILFVSKEDYKLGINIIKKYKYNLKVFSNNDQLYQIIENYRPYIVINDILDTDLKYIEQLKEKNIFIVNFEDLGEGSNKADLVINALYEERDHFKQNHYWGKDYYILREEFHLLGHKNVKKEINNLLITYGGTDPNNYTKRILNILNDLKLDHLQINVILGLGYLNLKELRKFIDTLKLKITLKQNVENISKYMYEADIVFTSAGRTVYELASMGTPTIVLAQNERELLHNLANEKNGIINLGLGYKCSDQKIKDVFLELMNDYELRQKYSYLMLKNNLKSGINNVISLIFSKYEKFHESLLNEKL